MFWKDILSFCAVFCSVSWIAAEPAFEDTRAVVSKDCKCAESDVNRWECKGLASADQLCIFSTADPKYNICDVESPACNVRHLQLRDSHINFELRNDFTALQTVDILNAKVECSQATLWLLNATLVGDLSSKFPQNCSSPETLKGVLVAKAMHLIRQVHSQCPERCSCELLNVPHDDQYVTVTINCTNQGFTELPKTLPSNFTIHLDLSNNQIDDLSELVTNPSYNRVTSLFLNNNRIKSILALESSEWIKRFTLLSLQGNELQEIPTKSFTNDFDNVNGFRMFLSNNPWRCDCVTVRDFQSFFVKHKEAIKDISNVTCAANEGENAGKKINSLETSSICLNPDADVINLMDIITVILAILTVSTIGKLLYDYYAYRKTGRLPWLVSKIP